MFSHHPVVILIPKGEESESEMLSDKPKIMQLICRIGIQTQSQSSDCLACVLLHSAAIRIGGKFHLTQGLLRMKALCVLCY